MADAVVVRGEAALPDQRLVEIRVVLRADDLLRRLVLLYQPDDVLVGGRGESRKPQSELASLAAEEDMGRGEADEREPDARDVDCEESEDEPQATRSRASRAARAATYRI